MNLIPTLQKHFKEGNKLYSVIHGWVTFDRIDLSNEEYPIRVEDPIVEGAIVSFTREGKHLKGLGECILFPNPDKDWRGFVEIEEGDAVVYLKDEVWHLGRAAKRTSINEIGVKDLNGDIYFPEKIVKAELFDFDNFENIKL